MKTQVREQLKDLQIVLCLNNLWEEIAPSEEKLASTQPFAIDTLSSTQWLQWIFIPRMHALLDGDLELPRNFTISAYLEESLKNERYLNELLKPIVEIEKICRDV